MLEPYFSFSVYNMSQDSGYNSEEASDCDVTLSTVSSMGYSQELDRILEKYEMAAKDEHYYLLHSTFPAGSYLVGCGLSPARTFSSAIMLYQENKPKKISFATFEWATFIDLLQHNTFFNEHQCEDAYESVKFPCGDFCILTQLVFNDTKYLEVRKHGISFYLTYNDVLQILHIDRSLISHRLSMLDSLNFCVYYKNVLETVKTFVNDNTTLSKLELMYAICDVSTDSMLTNALREYLFYYKINVINDLEGFNK